MNQDRSYNRSGSFNQSRSANQGGPSNQSRSASQGGTSGGDKNPVSRPSEKELRTIITDPEGAEVLVKCADSLGKDLKNSGLTTSQIRALFGEVRQIQAEWSVENRRAHARRRLILLKPKMDYRARKESGNAVKELVEVLKPALDLVLAAPPDKQDAYFQHFVEFFEAILAYHKAHGGN